MFACLNRLGPPVKYAVIGLLGGVLWLVIAFAIGYQPEPHGQAMWASAWAD